MKTLLFLLLTLVSTSVFAAKPVFLFDMEVSMGTDEPKTMKLSLEEGKMGAISSKNATSSQYIELIATEESVKDNKANILMKFKIFKVSESGEKQLISSPSILAIEGNEAQVKHTSKDKNGGYSLKVIAQRLVL